MEDGLNGVILANSMLLSTWLNKTIDLPFDDELFYEELKKRIAVSRLKTGEASFADLEGTYGGTK